MSSASINDIKESRSTKSSFYTGVVEDINDPEKLDRVRVRVLGVHIEERGSGENSLKTEELPWATVLAPMSFGTISGIGLSSAPVNGTWVLVVFDNNDFQKPIVLGAIKGKAQYNQSSASQGFTDPDGTYPLSDRLNEPDTNRLHRGEDYVKTTFAKNRDTKLEKNIKYTADGDSTSAIWNMPGNLNKNSKYPDNTVLETKSGHIIEIDDTEGNERIHIWHTSGSFMEFRPDGSVTSKVTAAKYEVVNSDSHLAVNGQRSATIDGDESLSVGADVYTTIGGEYKVSAGSSISFKAGAEVAVTAGNIFLN